MNTTLNIILLICTPVAGILAWLLGYLCYRALVDIIPRPLLIGLIFLILAVFLVAAILIISCARGTFEENVIFSSGEFPSAILMAAAGAVILFGAAALFQWIYGLGISGGGDPTSYVFVIDDSGSTEGSDPRGLRFSSIEDALKGMDDDFPFMVYRFATDTVMVRPMGPISDGITGLNGVSDGITEMKAALTQVLEDYDTGVWKGGSSPKVVLLTDGEATDINYPTEVDDLLQDYASRGIAISTVGLGIHGSILLDRISKLTGGVYIDISNASDLIEAMGSAARLYTVRDLLTTRYTTNMGPLYGFLRVLFITVLGGILGLTAALAYGRRDSLLLILLTSLGKALLGGLLLELFTSLIGAPDKLMWLILWILLAATIGLAPAAPKKPYRPTRKSYRSR